MNEYGFDSFERGTRTRGMCARNINEVRDNEIEALFDAKAYCDSATTATACCNFTSTADSISALDSSIAALSCNTASVTNSIDEVGRALKALSERVSKLEKGNEWGCRLKRSDLRTLRVG